MNANEFKNPVFLIGLILAGGLSIWGIVGTESFTEAAGAMFTFFTTDFGWLYLIAMLSFVIFVIAIACSKYGNIKLGPDDSKPEYSTVSWFAMLFGCGMGVGLVFWGIAEPISHYIGPIAGIEPGTPEAARFAMEASFMHWGIHPWANYAVVGLALAYFQFRKGKPGLVSTALEPLIGEKNTKGGLGKLVDILAVFATVAGVVTSLGLGVLQINAGLNYLFGIPVELIIQIIIIAVISLIYISSSVIGIDRGIKVIGDLNLYIAIGIMAVCFLVAIPGAGFIMDLFRGADSAFDPEVYRHTGFVLFCIMFFREIAEAVICISMGALRGVGDTRYVMLVQSGVDVFVWIPLVFAVAKWHPSVFALWLTMPVALGLMALLFLVRWRRGGWRGVDLVS